MDKRNIKKVILLLLIIIQTLIVGCSSHDSVQSISMGDVMEAEQKIEDLRVEIVKETMSEKLKKMYGDGLWKEDFSVEKEILDRALEKYFDEVCNVTSDVKFFTRSDMEYFNSDLKDLRDGKLTVDEFIKDPAKYIYNGEIVYYGWVEILNRDTKFLNYDEFERNIELLKKINGDINSYAFIISDISENEITYNEWKEMDNIRDLCNNMTSDIIFKLEDKNILRDKFNEEFRISSERYPGINKWFYSVNNPDVVFETNDYGGNFYTKYLSALSQKYITEIVKDIIKEEGAEDIIVPFIIPCGGDWRDIDLSTYDTGSIKTYDDKIKFLNEGFLGNYDVNLYYLKDSSEEIDYEMIFRTVKRIKKLVTVDGFKPGWADSRSHTAVYFYNLTDYDKETVKYLFDKYLITENYFSSLDTFQRITLKYWRDRDETEGFYYLDAFGEKENFFLNITGWINEDMTLDEFIKWSTEEEVRYGT